MKLASSLLFFSLVVAGTACGGLVEEPAGDPVAPVTPPTASARPGERRDEAAVESARAALVGSPTSSTRAWRVREIHVGGLGFGNAPEHYRERIEGEAITLCFRSASAVTICECSKMHVASVDDIKQGGHPFNTCFAPVSCSEGTYSFNAYGHLRIDSPSDLLWAVKPTANYGTEAGEVAVRPEGTYVRNLVGLGDALLEPASACP